MNEVRIEAALRSLGKNTPHAPEITVDNIVKTVRALNAARGKRAAQNTPTARADIHKDKEMSANKLPKAPSAGMSK
ncbi:MAG: hypothetical protein ILA24_02230 [Ruminococcus sp.]|nr:hypothetical protein [Ruminococcus sp.]